MFLYRLISETDPQFLSLSTLTLLQISHLLPPRANALQDSPVVDSIVFTSPGRGNRASGLCSHVVAMSYLGYINLHLCICLLPDRKLKALFQQPLKLPPESKDGYSLLVMRGLPEVKRPSNSVNFYSYAFKYCLTGEKQKSVDIETICQLLDLALESHFRAQVDYLFEYLNGQSDYKVTGSARRISFPDFSNYDENLAWQLILDNFVDWMQAKQKN